MIERLKDFLLGIDQRRAVIASRLLVFLMAVLHIGGGIILLDVDPTRGTPLVIEQYGIVGIRVFSMWMLAVGLLMLPFVFGPQTNLNTSGLIMLSSPFIAYICYTIYGVELGIISGQGAFLYIVLCAIVFVSHWGLQK